MIFCCVLKHMLRVEPSHTGAPHCRSHCHDRTAPPLCRSHCHSRAACVTRHILPQAKLNQEAKAADPSIIPSTKEIRDAYEGVKKKGEAAKHAFFREWLLPRFPPVFHRWFIHTYALRPVPNC